MNTPKPPDKPVPPNPGQQPHHPVEAPPVQQPESGNPFSAPISGNVPPPNAPQESANALDGIIPTNPLAAVSCYTGILGMVTCFGGIGLGPIAILLGVMALKVWKAQESNYGKTMSSVRAWIGIVTGIIGFIGGLITIILVIANA